MDELVREAYAKAFNSLKSKCRVEVTTLHDFVALNDDLQGFNLHTKGMHPYFDVVSEGFVFSVIYNRVEEQIEIAEVTPDLSLKQMKKAG